MNHDDLPCLALCPGEPAGIGPDITALVATRDIPARLFCVADPDVIRGRAETIGVQLDVIECPAPNKVERHRAGALQVVPVRVTAPVIPGQLDPRNAGYVLGCLDLAIGAARDVAADGIVTGPVHKGVINDAGYAFTGHTEYLVHDLDPRPVPVMTLVSGKLRVALATTHMALRNVPGTLHVDLIAHAIDVVATALVQRFGVSHPRIGICGLNPHAGENGHFGNEETDIITPAIEAARRDGVTLVGPLSADTAFAPAMRRQFDAYVSMYHDQSLPVIKALGFGEIVNVTLGIPILRTSVDHGTALELAGTGAARPDSLTAAIDMAVALSRKQP